MGPVRTLIRGPTVIDTQTPASNERAPIQRPDLLSTTSNGYAGLSSTSRLYINPNTAGSSKPSTPPPPPPLRLHRGETLAPDLLSASPHSAMAAADVAYAPPMKSGKAGFEGAMEPQHRIRITLSSRNVKNLEKGMIARRSDSVSGRMDGFHFLRHWVRSS